MSLHDDLKNRVNAGRSPLLSSGATLWFLANVLGSGASPELPV
jgi:hypothetical protein